MTIDQTVLFFFSAIGAFNGLFLSIYFTFFIKNRSRAMYFLSALILVVSVRILKSSFLFFNSEINDAFRVTGLTAFALIGPFLYLYVKSSVYKENSSTSKWWLHIVPVIVLMTGMQLVFPYHDHLAKWYSLVNMLYCLWLAYIVVSAWMIREPLRRFFKRKKIQDEEFWLVSVTLAIAIIWVAYFTVSYTSYIVGALSFSFIFYVMLLLWLYKRKKAYPFFYEPPKYANKSIDASEASQLGKKLEHILREEKLYKHASLKLADVAKRIAVPTHQLSQYLNDNLGQRFNAYINTYRIEEAEQLLQENDHLTLEAIGAECGFKSNSSFYTAFKKEKGITPAQYKKSLK